MREIINDDILHCQTAWERDAPATLGFDEGAASSKEPFSLQNFHRQECLCHVGGFSVEAGPDLRAGRSGG